MSFLTENVIPSDHGRIFGTNATTDKQVNKMKTAIEGVEGVIDMVPIKEVFPKEFVVHTSKLVAVKTIEDAVNKIGLHCIPKGIFPKLEK